MAPPIVICPVCSTKTRKGRNECPQCEASLADATPAPSAAKAVADDRGKTDEPWRVRPVDLGLVAFGIVMMLLMGRDGEEPPRRRPAAAAAQVAEMPATTAAHNASPATGDVRGAAREPLAWGHQWIEVGAYAEAVTHFERAVAKDPTDAKARHELGRTLVQLDRHQEAIPHFEAAVQLDTAEWVYHASLADALAHLRLWDRTASVYRNASIIRPDDLDMLYRLAQALHESGNELAAVKAYFRVIELAPADAELYRRLGQSYEALDQPEEASAAYGRYLALAPEGPWTTEITDRLGALAAGDAPRAGGRAPDPSGPARAGS